MMVDHQKKRPLVETTSESTAGPPSPIAGGPKVAVREDGSCSNLFVTFDEWWNRRSMETTEANDGGTGRGPLPLVDLRPADEYARRRICYVRASEASSTPVNVVNLPMESLLSGERSCELPPRHVEFAVLVPKEYCSAGRDMLQCHREGDAITGNNVHRSISDFFFATCSRTTNQSRKPWRVRQILRESSIPPSSEGLDHSSASPSILLWDEVERAGVLAENEALPPMPWPRLWEPDTMVRMEVLPILSSMLNRSDDTPILDANEDEACTTSCDGTRKLEVWDLGCGAGRDICFLAEEMKHYLERHRVSGSKTRDNCPSIRYVGFDNHKGSAARCIPLWQHRNVQDVTRTKLIDLTKIDLFHQLLRRTQKRELNRAERLSNSSCATEAPLAPLRPPAEKENSGVVLCYCVRYLNRNLLKYLASERCLLRKGSYFAMSYFCRASDDAEWPFDHPKIQNVLERDELRRLFEGSGIWKILKDKIALDGDFGRTMVQFIAQKV